MNTTKHIGLSILAVVGAICVTTPAFATPILGTNLASFTVLGASTVTNVPTSTIVGNVGVWSSGGANAITGFNSSPGVGVSDPQVTGGSVYAGGALAQLAQSELTTARNNLASLGVGTLLASDLTLAGTLAPGVYTVPAGITNLSGALTLDGGGNANAAWVFQMPSSLITSPNSVVNVINTGSGAGVFWNVQSSATIDVNTTFLGNILALTAISFNTSATNFCGRALANTAAVTLDQNSLTGVCFGGGLDVVSSGASADVVNFLPFATVATSSVPEPGVLTLMGLGIVGILFTRRRRHVC